MQQGSRKRVNLGLLIIVGTLSILMLILVVVVGVLIYSRVSVGASNSIIGRSSLNQLEPEQIDPALAVASLGGVPETEIIAEALAKDRPETALSVLLFNPTLNNKESAGGFLKLAQTYGGDGNFQAAIFSYKMAGAIGTLAPNLPDTVRADIFLQAGEGLTEIEAPELAQFYLKQAFTVASKSPYLQAAHRRRIFERLQKNFIALDERALARESLNLGANPPKLELVSQIEIILPEGDPIPLPEEIQNVVADRWWAAQELAALLVARGGKVEQEDIAPLAQMLVAEDLLKLPYYRQEFANATQLSRKIDVTMAQIKWLSVKYRVARRGFGLSIVPEWEADAERIRADLTKTYEALFALYADLVVALPDVSEIDKATEERLRIEILAGEIGRYPNYPEEQRRSQLLDATERLITTQPEINIFVGAGEVDNEKMYTLITRE